MGAGASTVEAEGKEIDADVLGAFRALQDAYEPLKTEADDGKVLAALQTAFAARSTSSGSNDTALAGALAELEGAIAGLNKLSVMDVSVVRTLAQRPPQMEGMCLLVLYLKPGGVEHTEDWEGCKAMLGASDFLQQLKEYPKDSITQNMMSKVKTALQNPKMTRANMKKTNILCYNLMVWLEAIVNYYDAASSTNSTPEQEQGRDLDREDEDSAARQERNAEFRAHCGAYVRGKSKVNQVKARQLLEEHPGGLDVNGCDADGWTALHHAAGEGHNKVVMWLASPTGGVQASLDVAAADGCTPLWVACHNGHRAVVEILLRLGADADLRGRPEGEPETTPALAARRNRNPGIADVVDAENRLRAASGGTRLKAERAGKLELVDFKETLRDEIVSFNAAHTGDEGGSDSAK